MKMIYTICLIISLFQLGFSQEMKQELKNPDSMKTPFLGLRTVAYHVSDIQKAKDWYSEAFGVKPYFDESYYVGFNIGGYELGLQPEEDSTKEKTENVVTFWGVNDIEKEYKRLIELGATENEKPSNVGGDIITATVKDPWSNVIGIIYNPEFKVGN